MPLRKALVAAEWADSELQLAVCGELSHELGAEIALKDGLPASTVLLPGCLPLFVVARGCDEALRLLAAVKRRLVAVVVVRDDEQADDKREAAARTELSARALRLDGPALTVHHASDGRSAVHFIGAVSGVLDKQTLPAHAARADAIYGAMAAAPPAEAIARLAAGGLNEHSALVLEHTFGSVAGVIRSACDHDAVVSSSVSAAEARDIARFVSRNKVVAS